MQPLHLWHHRAHSLHLLTPAHLQRRLFTRPDGMRTLKVAQRLLVARLRRGAEEDLGRLPLDPRNAGDLEAPLAERGLNGGIFWQLGRGRNERILDLVGAVAVGVGVAWCVSSVSICAAAAIAERMLTPKRRWSRFLGRRTWPPSPWSAGSRQVCRARLHQDREVECTHQHVPRAGRGSDEAVVLAYHLRTGPLS